MKAYKRGVLFYTQGWAYVSVGFPEGKTVCRYCKFLQADSVLHRPKCVITDELIAYPETGMGQECPLDIEEGKE